METIEVDALTSQGNYAVVRLPNRRYPGVVVQGDSLAGIVASCEDSLNALRRGAFDDAEIEISALLADLHEVKSSYEAVLAAHSIPLPY